MRTNLRNLLPMLVMALVLLWGPVPVLTADGRSCAGGEVVELGPEAYNTPVYIPEPLVPVGPESSNASQQTLERLAPVFLGVITLGFPLWGQ